MGYELVARYRSEGEAAFETRSKRPRTSPTKTSDEVIALILATRRRLVGEGMDAGMGTIRWHLEHHHAVSVSESTIHRTLVAGGLVTPAPRKRPRNSYVRFQAEQPNECWQADMTHVRLVDGVDVEVLSWLDDHSRYALSVTAHVRVTTPVVVDTFTHTIAELGIPASTLTDNGLYFTTRFAGGGTGGRNGFEALLVRLGVVQKNSRPNHPTTCGNASAATSSTPPAKSRSATTVASTRSASADPGAEPPSSCSSPISTSAFSMPPPARSSAPSPSTPPAPTSEPADPSEHPENQQTRTPNGGSGVRNVSRHHRVELGGIEPPSTSP